MSWSIEKTLRIITVNIVLMFAFMIIEIYLLLQLVDNPKGKKLHDKSVTYVLGMIYANGLGCICFRVFRRQVVVLHIALHTVGILMMLKGHRDILEAFEKKDLEQLLFEDHLTLHAELVHFIVYSLAFLIVGFGCVSTRIKKANSDGLHAFTGTMAFLIFIMCGVGVTDMVLRRAGMLNTEKGKFCVGAVLLYSISTLFLMLNPNFDWRRINFLLLKRRRDAVVSYCVS